MENQPLIGRYLRIKVIDWLYEIIQKFQITDKDVVPQAVELMDCYYHNQSQSLPSHDLQLTATTCFFIAAKNSMVEPFTLQNAIETMCYNKFKHVQFVAKEKEIRKCCQLIPDKVSTFSFVNHFIRVIKYEFCKYQQERHGKFPTKVIKPTHEFMKELEVLCYELTKFMMADCMT